MSRKIKTIVQNEFKKEINLKETELQNIDKVNDVDRLFISHFTVMYFFCNLNSIMQILRKIMEICYIETHGKTSVNEL